MIEIMEHLDKSTNVGAQHVQILSGYGMQGGGSLIMFFVFSKSRSLRQQLARVRILT